MQEIIQIRTKQYKELKKKIAKNRQERLIREDVDDGSTDSEEEEAKLKAQKKAKAKAAAAAKGGGS